ncbi:MAG: hypothetical protein KA744_17925, partial [Phenylobacterium sp.]|nr:hypothetical protein [Phenylobacterium sp.]
MTRALIAAIETGGSKILCRVTEAHKDPDAAGEAPPDHRFATTTPQTAMAELVGAIKAVMAPGDHLAAIGLAS